MHPHSAPGKTNPARVILPFIYCAGWVYVLKPVLSLIRFDGINFCGGGGVFNCLSSCLLLRKTGFKLNLAIEINPPGIFYPSGFMLFRKPGLKTKHRHRSNFLKNLFLSLNLCFLSKTAWTLNISKEVNPSRNIYIYSPEFMFFCKTGSKTTLRQKE